MSDDQGAQPAFGVGDTRVALRPRRQQAPGCSCPSNA